MYVVPYKNPHNTYTQSEIDININIYVDVTYKHTQKKTSLIRKVRSTL